jgi:predicted Rossmann fold flavoprotein
VSKDTEKVFDILIAGGGASGMTAACFCACASKASVALIEKNDTPGKKLSATGNGKCNMSNEKMDVSCYNGDTGFVSEILAEYPVEKVLGWFEKLGIKTVSKNGYLYPMSEQAKSVSEALEREVRRLNVPVLCGLCIEDIKRENGLFIVSCRDKEGSTTVFKSKKLILSLGGPASNGGSDIGIKILKSFGHKINEVRPALVALKSDDKILKKLAGVRLQADITLNVCNKAYKEKGEIIFNDGNVSGIPVFCISRFLPLGNAVSARLDTDLLPALTLDETAGFLMRASEHNPSSTNEQLFRGILNYKAVYYIFERCGIDPEETAGMLSKEKAMKLAGCFKHFSLNITGTKGFESAQTSAGGAALDEFDPATLESKKIKGLYVTGELLDVDGICGGYNLHFAWATGMKAGKELSETL